MKSDLGVSIRIHLIYLYNYIKYIYIYIIYLIVYIYNYIYIHIWSAPPPHNPQLCIRIWRHNSGSALAQLNILYSLFPLSASILKLHCIVLHTSRCFLSLGSSTPRSVFAVTSNLCAGSRRRVQPGNPPGLPPPTPPDVSPHIQFFGAHDTAGVGGPITRHTREPIATNVFQKKNNIGWQYFQYNVNTFLFLSIL